MAAAVPVILSKESQEGLKVYTNAVMDYFGLNYNMKNSFEINDRLYQREQDLSSVNTKSKLANRYGDPSKLQNITVPIILPQVETGVAYQTSVFLTGIPIFGVVGSPKYQDAALQMETVIDNEATKGGWVNELIAAFRDAYKYGVCAIEVDWETELTPTFETDVQFSTSEARVNEVLWEGNVVKRLNMYNTFWDTRVPAQQVAEKGEFAGYTEIYSRTELKRLIAKLGVKTNINEAFESSFDVSHYYTPQINPDAWADINQSQDSFNWEAWVNASNGRKSINYKNSYAVTKLYARIIPNDFNVKVPNRNTPQIWKLYIVNNSVILHAVRLTNAHDLLPILLCQPHNDGLDYQSKSFAGNLEPIQQYVSTLMNSVVASRRRQVFDRKLYNPLLIDKAVIDNTNPAANMPVKPAAYGRNLQEAVYQLPYNDRDAAVVLQEIPMISGFADQVSGQNQASQGRFVKGNKTRYEFETITGNADGRQQLAALSFETQLFTPMKHIIKTNILQYQGGVTLFNREQKREVNVDPIVLRKAIYEFKISDGLVPSSKIINSEAWTTALQMLATSPEISSGYNIAPLFSYLIKTQGADIKEFEKPPEQVQYEQAISAWQQTVMQLVKDNPEITPEQYPPQPKPTDFGMDESGNVINNQNQQQQEPTILEQVTARINNETAR